MSYLLYSSDEMFSATELLRKSKNIFDKVSTNKIDKAIILRDGKPTFLLFDFKKYESIMKDYEYYKSYYNTYNNTNNKASISAEQKKLEDISVNDIIVTPIDTKVIKLEETNGTKDESPKLKDDDFVVELSNDTTEVNPSGEIKEFWNE
jgi:hypothetical protein